MPFCPLPRTFLDDLDRCRHDRVLELGCGDGVFTDLMRQRGVEVVTLDRRHPAVGSVARVVGDALRPPVRDASCALVVASNLLRHLWPQLRAGEGPQAWRRLVGAEGCLYIFEDEPVDAPPPARNYRDLQALLARLEGVGRGPLLARSTFLAAVRGWRWPGTWCDGAQENTWPAEPRRVLSWLAGRQRQPGGEVDRLCRAIARDGLSYGSFWWARWTPEGRT